jgi:hypothetical protein
MMSQVLTTARYHSDVLYATNKVCTSVYSFHLVVHGGCKIREVLSHTENIKFHGDISL